MGTVSSVVVRAIQRFNVENRAQRVIAQDKPKPAPKFESNIKDLERVLRDHPEIVEQAGKKDAMLDGRLKKVFVTSSEYLEQKRYVNPDKPLPLNRKPVSEFELGYQETDPKRVGLGKCTLRQAIKFISDHQQQPSDLTAEKVANELKLKKDDVHNILEHFRMFAIHIPKEQGKTKKFLIDPFHRKSSNFNELLEDVKGKSFKEKEADIQNKQADK